MEQMKVIAPKEIKGEVNLPPSKSISNRALAIGSLTEGDSTLANVSICDDTKVMAMWMAKRIQKNFETIDIGAAGTAMRFSTAMLAVLEGTQTITGSERMKQRPIGILVEALRTLGAQVEYVEKEGFPPLRITGVPQMEGGEVELAGNVSSQFISALLLIAPRLKKGLTLKLTGEVVSRPYIDMTLSMMRIFGAKAGWTDAQTIVVEPVRYQPCDFRVESDWSAASYWYEVVALAPNEDAEVVLHGLFTESLQGDSRGAKVFERLGVSTEYRGEDVVLRKNGQCVERLDEDFVDMPDLAQTFVVTCCMLGVPFHFTGLQSLKIKETDRIEALKRELAKLGFRLEDRNDSELIWDGMKEQGAGSKEQEECIDTYEDHRMAMAFAPVALKRGSIIINNPQVVSKSYPFYWKDLKAVGFDLPTFNPQPSTPSSQLSTISFEIPCLI